MPWSLIIDKDNQDNIGGTWWYTQSVEHHEACKLSSNGGKTAHKATESLELSQSQADYINE